MKIDHIAIAVNKIDDAIIKYKNLLNTTNIHFEQIDIEGVKLAILYLDNCRIELMEPLNDQSSIKKFIDKHGEGLHHIALETNDIIHEKNRLTNCGMQFLGNIRKGSSNTMITFIHPKSLSGVLLELCAYKNNH